MAPEEFIVPSLVILIFFSVPYLFQKHLHLQVLSWLLFFRTFPSSMHSLGPSPAYSAAHGRQPKSSMIQSSTIPSNSKKTEP